MTLNNRNWTPFPGLFLGALALILGGCQDGSTSSPSTVVGSADPSSIITIEEEIPPGPEESRETPDTTEAPPEEIEDTWTGEDTQEGEEGEEGEEPEEDAGEEEEGGEWTEGGEEDGADPEEEDGTDPGEEEDTVEPEPEPEPEPNDPGNVTLHRLNRTEYNNTVQDLFGTEQTPAENFPADDQGYGFDNIADVLSISPLHFELYELAARGLVDEALYIPFVEPSVFFFEAEQSIGSVGGPNGQSWNLWSVGTISNTFTAEKSGTYQVRARMWATQLGDEWAESSLLFDGAVFYTEDIEATADGPEIIQGEAYLAAGTHEVAVSFNNDAYLPDEGLDRNLYVDWFEVTGPLDTLDAAPVNPIREALVICEPGEGETFEAEEEKTVEPIEGDGNEGCVQEILEAFVPRAWRRPVTPEEMAMLVGLYTLAASEGAEFDEALSVPLIATLLSPHFLFRVELDEDPTDPTPHLLSDHELASRLSYFLWSSMPDELLLQAADEGILQDPVVLAEETLRMLADPKSVALVDNYAGQWLYLRGLWDAAPDKWAFPEWTGELQASMASEAWLFVYSFITSDRPMTELLTSSTSFVDQALADHYGLEGLELAPGEFAEVDVTGVNRGGFLRQAGLLTTLSFPTRTSPVKRGKWVLGQLLCMEPPPPPPGVEGLIDDSEEATTIAEQMKQHSADPACSGCHSMMDPIGLGLENFDGIGRFRTEDKGFPIDASGALPNGMEFEGASGLIDHLSNDTNLTHCMSEKLLTYALGRGVETADDPYLEDITNQFVEGGLTFSQLVLSIVTSEPFRMRRGEPVVSEEEEGE